MSNVSKSLLVAVCAAAVSMTLVVGRAQTGQSPSRAPSKVSVLRLDSALDEIIAPGTQLEMLKDGFKDGLEGGVWMHDGFLLFSNKPEHVIAKWAPDAPVGQQYSVYLNLGEIEHVTDPKTTLSSGTTLDKDGRLVYCSPGDRQVIRIEKDGKRTVIADTFNGQHLVHPNDLVYKSNGTLYFTDNGDAPEGEKGLPRSTYMLKNGKVELVSTGMLVHPNGIAISPDEKFLYVNDSGEKQVWRFEIQADDSAVNPKLWLDESIDPAPGIPDGMRVDKKGNVFDAGPGGYWIMSPEGKHLGTLLNPDRATNLAFGGKDGKTLYLTNHTSLYQIRVKVEGLRP